MWLGQAFGAGEGFFFFLGNMAALADAARAAGHRSLRDDGRQKVLDGVTTPEEVIRVLG